jgi:hypothetical protein
MLERPGSKNGFLWFLYRTRRKIHILRTHGTLFHKTPVGDRLKNYSYSRLKRSRRRRRKFRHMLFYFRYGTLTRYNRKLNSGFRKEKEAQTGTQRDSGKYLIILLNSTFIFLLAYLFVFLLKEMAAVIAAGTFNIKSVMMYYDVDFLIRSRDWTADAVNVIFSAGPLVAFILTLINITIFAMSSNENWTVRLFIMWIFLHGFTQSFGEMIFGPLLNQGFGWVLTYLYFNDTTKMLIVIGILLGMISGGLFLSRFLLLTGNIYFNTISKVNRSPFLMSQIFLPFLIGTGIIILVKQPLVNSFELVVQGSMFFIILPAILRARLSNDLFFDEEVRTIRIKWVWILITLVSFILFRIYFWKGIRI